jgi:hypothetical protein
VAVDDTERARVKAWLAAQRWLAERQREERRRAGPDPAAAVDKLLAMARFARQAGTWPGPRDRASERRAETVRQRWITIHDHVSRTRTKAR